MTQWWLKSSDQTTLWVLSDSLRPQDFISINIFRPDDLRILDYVGQRIWEVSIVCKPPDFRILRIHNLCSSLRFPSKICPTKKTHYSFWSVPQYATEPFESNKSLNSVQFAPECIWEGFNKRQITGNGLRTCSERLLLHNYLELMVRCISGGVKSAHHDPWSSKTTLQVDCWISLDHRSSLIRFIFLGFEGRHMGIWEAVKPRRSENFRQCRWRFCRQICIWNYKEMCGWLAQKTWNRTRLIHYEPRENCLMII